MPRPAAELSDLYRLAEQLELDRDTPVSVARERDHAIGADCGEPDDAGRLLHWLEEMTSQRAPTGGKSDPWLGEASAAALARLLALVLGAAGMATFLLGSARGLVNVFVFLFLFVVVQCLLCLVAAVATWRTVRGRPPVVLPVNPAHLIVNRVFPDQRYLREARSVVRLLFLRYGQELGAIFTLGAIAAFFAVLALSDFSFVWGSTFQLSDDLVERMAGIAAAPWATLVPEATVSGALIADTRFSPAITHLSAENAASMRGWWPFLIMATVSYALLPRLLLWLVSRLLFRRELRRAMLSLPGSERVLARMKLPLVETRGEEAGRPPAARPEPVPTDRRLLLLNWASALQPEDRVHFPVLAAVADDRRVNAGLGSPAAEREQVAEKLGPPVEHLYVAVKSWEPPMADLADFLASFGAIPRCTLFLVPLASRPVSATRLGDWEVFARDLVFPVVDVQVLEEATAP